MLGQQSALSWFRSYLTDLMVKVAVKYSAMAVRLLAIWSG
jgi:hypothetical protein